MRFWIWMPLRMAFSLRSHPPPLGLDLPLSEDICTRHSARTLTLDLKSVRKNTNQEIATFLPTAQVTKYISTPPPFMLFLNYTSLWAEYSTCNIFGNHDKSEVLKSYHISDKTFLSIPNSTFIFLYEHVIAQAVLWKTVLEDLHRNLEKMKEGF